MLLLPELMSGADCPLLLVWRATLQQDRIWYSQESRRAARPKYEIVLKGLSNSMRDAPLARKDNIVDGSEIV
jgi:hypothetical protein